MRSRMPVEPRQSAIWGITRAIAPLTVLWQLAACAIALERVMFARFWRWIARSSAAWLADVA